MYTQWDSSSLQCLAQQGLKAVQKALLISLDQSKPLLQKSEAQHKFGGFTWAACYPKQERTYLADMRP